MPPTPADSDLPGPAWVPQVLIVAAVIAAYANSLGTSFQFDDWNVIVDEPNVSTLTAWWHSMPGIRPLLKLTYALNSTIAAGALGFHVVNTAIHATAACLMFVLLAKCGGRRLALLATLLFALHPVQTEAVTYVCGRSTSLMAMLALASIAAWMNGHTKLLSPALFVAALLVKETAVVVPLAIVLVDVVVRGKPRWPIAHLVVLAAGALAVLSSPTYRRLLTVSLKARAIEENLLTQANGVFYLAGQLVRLDRLNADPRLPVITSLSWPVALQALALITVIVVGFALLRRRPKIAFGILWFFIWLLPTNSILPRLDVANDRQLYLSIAGPAWLAALALLRLARTRRAASAALALTVIAALGVATHLRNRVYEDEITFWQDVVEKSPHNARAHNNLGYALFLDGQQDAAEAEFGNALRLDPTHMRAAVNLRLLRAGALHPPHSSPTP